MGNRGAGTIGDKIVKRPSSRQMDRAVDWRAPIDEVDIQAVETASIGTQFDADLRAVLSEGDLFAARGLVAQAEAALAVHETASVAGAPAPQASRAELAAAKARIAAADNDTIAAHAILVHAIEKYPDAGPLRALMAEIMFATGRATNIRPVLQNLGRVSASETGPIADHPTDMTEKKISDSQG